MSTHKPTPGPLTYFVGNADGRGLIRIETDATAPVAGVHICSMQRGAQSEANAAAMVSRWNSHDALVQALKAIHIQAADAQLRASYQRTALEQISELAQKALAQVAP